MNNQTIIQEEYEIPTLLPFVRINNERVVVREYSGQRVITFDVIDAVHGRPTGTAARNFSANKHRFIEGEDYFHFEGQQGREALQIGNYTNFVELPTSNNFSFYLFSQTGYLMLVKSFRDELAWQIQRLLVKGYFTQKSIMTTPDIANALRLIANAFEEQAKALDEAQNKIEKQQVKIDITANHLQKIDEMYKIEVDPTWMSASKLAKKMKLYSESGNPHACLVTSIASMAGINVRRNTQRKTEDVHVIAKREGETVIFDLFFSPVAVNKVTAWWINNKKKIKFTEQYRRSYGHHQVSDIRKMGYYLGERKYYIQINA